VPRRLAACTCRAIAAKEIAGSISSIDVILAPFDIDYVVFKHGHWVADIVAELGQRYRFETRVGLKIGANDVGDISPEIVGREWAGTTFTGTLTIEFKGGALAVPNVTIVGRESK
jgi:hypothetical protein